MAELRRRAERLAVQLPEAEPLDCIAAVGGGGAPDVELPSAAVSLPESYAAPLRANRARKTSGSSCKPWHVSSETTARDAAEAALHIPDRQRVGSTSRGRELRHSDVFGSRNTMPRRAIHAFDK